MNMNVAMPNVQIYKTGESHSQVTRPQLSTSDAVSSNETNTIKNPVTPSAKASSAPLTSQKAQIEAQPSSHKTVFRGVDPNTGMSFVKITNEKTGEEITNPPESLLRYKAAAHEATQAENVKRSMHNSKA